MLGINKVILIGTVGNDPEIHYFDNDLVCARFSLVTNEMYRNKMGERITTSEWHKIAFWRKLAEHAEKYVKKGMNLYIEGKLQSRTWEDKSGTKHYTSEVVGNNFVMLSSAKEKSESVAEVKSPDKNDKIDFNIDEADRLPF